MIDVNLLPQQNVIARQDLKVKTYSIVAAIGFSVITGLIIFGMLGMKAYQDGELARLAALKADYDSQLVSLSDRATDLLTLKKKAKGISEIEKQRYDFKAAFGYVTGILPTAINLDTLTINNSGEVILHLSSGNVSQVVAYIKSVTEDINLKESHVQSISLNDEKGTNVVLDSKYGKSTKNLENN